MLCREFYQIRHYFINFGAKNTVRSRTRDLLCDDNELKKYTSLNRSHEKSSAHTNSLNFVNITVIKTVPFKILRSYFDFLSPGSMVWHPWVGLSCVYQDPNGLVACLGAFQLPDSPPFGPKTEK